MISSLIWIYAKGAILNCEYGREYYDGNGQLYQCKGELLQLNENDTIIKSVTKPTNNYYNLNDVRRIRIEDQNLIRFPSDVEKFFKNIEAIIVKNTSIKDISNEILRVFPSLTYLDLSNNQISAIPNNLFIYNEKLEKIDLPGNKINFLAPDTFDGLKSLKVIDLRNNTGINEIASTSDEINYFKIKLLVKNLEKRQTETMEKMFTWMAKCEFKFGNSAY